MAGIVEIPIAMEQTSLRLHALVEGGVGIGCQDMEGCCLDTLSNGPLDGSIKYAFVVLVHAENEARVDHDAEVMQAADRSGVVAIEVLEFALLAQVRGAERLESNEE